MTDLAKAVVLYDRDCGFCRWAMARVLDLDRRRAIVPAQIQSPRGDDLLAGMPAAERLASWHLVAPDGTRHSGGAAAAPLVRLLGAPRIAGAFERVPWVIDRAYRLVAGNRTLVGKLVPAGARARADAAVRRREQEGVPA